MRPDEALVSPRGACPLPTLEELSEWYLFILGGTKLVGRRHPGVILTGWHVIWPCYEYGRSFQMVPYDGPLDIRAPPRMVPRMLQEATPVSWLASSPAVFLPISTPFVLLSQLSEQERKDILDAITACEVIVAKMRAQDAKEASRAEQEFRRR